MGKQLDSGTPIAEYGYLNLDAGYLEQGKRKVNSATKRLAWDTLRVTRPAEEYPHH